MSNDLVHVLHERAETVDGIVDPAEVLRAGRRRLVRRSVTRGVTSAVLVTSAALVGVAAVVDDDTTTAPPVATQSMESASYSMGAIILRDDVVLSVGEPVTSFVRVPTGIVFTIPDGRVRLLPAGAVEAITIGRTSATDPHLVADPAHDQVAWVTFPEEGAPQYVVYDVAARAARESWPDTEEPWTFSPERAWVYAVDGDDLYRLDSRGAVRVDLETGRTEVLATGADRDTIGSVVGGTVAWRSDVEGYVVGDRFGEGVPTGRRRLPILSPGGTYLSTADGGAVHVQRARDGADVTPSVPKADLAAAYAWGDDDHVLVVTVPDLDPRRVNDLVFWTCSVSVGRCVESGRWQMTTATFALPTGDRAGSVLGD